MSLRRRTGAKGSINAVILTHVRSFTIAAKNCSIIMNTNQTTQSAARLSPVRKRFAKCQVPAASSSSWNCQPLQAGKERGGPVQSGGVAHRHQRARRDAHMPVTSAAAPRLLLPVANSRPRPSDLEFQATMQPASWADDGHRFAAHTTNAVLISPFERTTNSSSWNLRTMSRNSRRLATALSGPFMIR
jgi:hypothetical protein